MMRISWKSVALILNGLHQRETFEESSKDNGAIEEKESRTFQDELSKVKRAFEDVV